MAGGNIEYLYDSAGVKLKKTVTEPGRPVKTQDYLSGFIYSNGVLELFPTAEGYVKNTVVSGANSFNYVYNYTDHLGNVRVSYGQDPVTQAVKILEENNYYPFGLKHKNYNMSQKNYTKTNGGVSLDPICVNCAVPFKYNYKYNGKELQDELSLNLYDYGGRQYDPAIGRTTTLDPLAEKFYDLSPQSFLNNNPLRFIDPTGMESEDITDPPVKKTATDRAYNPKTGNTDLAKLILYKAADILSSINTYTREKIDTSDKDIGSTATSKNGGGENQKTTGKKTGDNINADAFLDGAPGAAKTGNNLTSNKDIMKAAADLGKLSSKFDKTEKKINEVIKENSGKGSSPSEFVRVSYDPKTQNATWVRKDIYDAQQKKK